MSESSAERILVCYVPGLDARRVDDDRTPFLSALRREQQVLSLRTLPSTELVPSIVSGTLPHQHRIWQVSLKSDFRSEQSRGIHDRMPDSLVTTLQCAHHFFDRTYDLAVIPWRRRRRFNQHRFKYTRRAASCQELLEFAGFSSIFGLLADKAEYVFTKDFESLPKLAQELPTGNRLIEFVEMYALDLVQHWHLDNVDVMNDALSRTDEFVRNLHTNCRKRGVRFVLLVDHGQEEVVGTIPLLETIHEAGVPDTEYTHFVELASARFWFHTERARRALRDALKSLPDTTVLSWQEMHRHQVCFEDDAFGELYVFADAGKIFFPHDFYQPIGNAVQGLLDRHQRQRVQNPVHRGNHGYLPHFESEKGWLIADEAILRSTRDSAELVDLAPSFLSLVGVTPPDYMKGDTLFA